MGLRKESYFGIDPVSLLSCNYSFNDLIIAKIYSLLDVKYVQTKLAIFRSEKKPQEDSFVVWTWLVFLASKLQGCFGFKFQA